jgi:hypothetical protein
MATPGQSIYERRASRSAQLACAFVVGTTALYAATWLFNLLLIFRMRRPNLIAVSPRSFSTPRRLP